ncbi:MAG: hypothetical protein JJW00_07045 [Sulfurimonas sp.]|nr:hypothetical protein [Sulfurimonas sp.]
MKSQIDLLHDEVNELLSRLYSVSTKKGFHLDNDLETGLFMLLVDDDYNEMFLLKNRVITAIKQIENGTFKISEADETLSVKKVA